MSAPCQLCADIPEEALVKFRARVAAMKPGDSAAIVLRLDVVVTRQGVLRVKASPDWDEEFLMVRALTPP